MQIVVVCLGPSDSTWVPPTRRLSDLPLLIALCVLVGPPRYKGLPGPLRPLPRVQPVRSQKGLRTGTGRTLPRRPFGRSFVRWALDWTLSSDRGPVPPVHSSSTRPWSHTSHPFSQCTLYGSDPFVTIRFSFVKLNLINNQSNSFLLLLQKILPSTPVSPLEPPSPSRSDTG